LTRKRATPRFQMSNPSDSGDNRDLYGSISVSKREARLGGHKLVAVASDRKKTLFVNIPPGVSEGTTVRLQRLGRLHAEGVKDNLYLAVQIK
jgi:DnaJ-class molecular chaperone